ncbi:MAG: DUF4124 domain-containing protein [Aquisalimonadaceae bacterium]
MHPVRLAVIVGLLPVLLLLPGADIYRHVDADGNVTFSDKPGPDSQSIDLRAPSTYQPPPTPTRRSGTASEERQDEEESGYRSVRILRPEQEETFRDNQGNISVMSVTEPTLHKGHLLQLVLDGEPHGEPQRGMAFRLTGVNRGEHTVQVRVVDQDAQSVAESETRTFYLHQASRLFPPRQSSP